MQYAESILELVGDTPLVRLTRVTRDLGPVERQPLLLAKLEMLNPGGKYLNGIRRIEDKSPPGWDRSALFEPGYYDYLLWRVASPRLSSSASG
jgi:hypothetical protein